MDRVYGRFALGQEGCPIIIKFAFQVLDYHAVITFAIIETILILNILKKCSPVATGMWLSRGTIIIIRRGNKGLAAGWQKQSGSMLIVKQGIGHFGRVAVQEAD